MKKGSIFTLEGDGPPMVKDPETNDERVRMLLQMIDALLEENNRKDEEILRLRNELDLRKKLQSP